MTATPVDERKPQHSHWLCRALRCHEADVILRQSAPAALPRYVLRGHLEGVEDDEIELLGIEGWGPAHYAAAARGSAALMRLAVLGTVSPLSACPCDVVIPRTEALRRDAHGRTALHVACLMDHCASLRALLQSTVSSREEATMVLVETVDAAHRCLMDVALSNHAWWCVLLLLQLHTEHDVPLPQAVLNRILAYRWSSPPDLTHSGVGVGWRQLMERLANAAEYTLLHISLLEPTLEGLVQQLCSRCPALCTVAAGDGCLPLHLAARYGTEPIRALLLRCDADGVSSISPWSTQSGRLPVHVLCRSGGLSKSLIAWLTKALHAKNLELGADQLLDADGRTPLHHACSGLGSTGDVVRFYGLIETLTKRWGVSLDLPLDNHGCSPRDAALQGMHGSTVRTLLDELGNFYESHEF